jgi:hypothetical protein
MTAGQVAAIVTSKVAAGGITNLTTLALNDTAINDTVTANVLGKATAATVVATGASAAEVGSIVTNLANITSTGITGALPVTSAVTASNIKALFGQYNAATALVVATSMNSAALDVVAANATKIAAASITGVMALTSGQSDTELTALFGKYSGTTATAVATTMDAAAVDVLAVPANIAKLSAITGTLALTNTQDSTELTALCGKYSGTTATAVATTMDATSIGLLVTNVGKIAVGGITGTLTLTKAQFATTDVAAALNSTATVSVDTWTDADSVNAAKIDNVVTGITALTGDAQATKVDVDDEGEWYFEENVDDDANADELTYFDGTNPVTITLTGTTAVTLGADGIFALTH